MRRGTILLQAPLSEAMDSGDDYVQALLGGVRA
jgi:hypothetical protein